MPATGSPVTRLRGPREPTPCWTFETWRGYHFAPKSERIPPWCENSRYQSFAPSHGRMQTRCGGWSAAAWYWFIA